MKRKLKKELEVEVQSLRQDIYNLISFKAKPIDKVMTEFKWKVVFDMEDTIWNGSSKH